MTTKRLLIILAVMALLLVLALPNVASAQRLPPHVFVGTATVDGAAASDGTAVTAWVGGVQVASGAVSGGSYTIVVDQGDQSFAGQTVNFQIGGNDAAESATWTQGGGDELNLTATTALAPAGKVVTINLGALNASGQTGTATLTEGGAQTEVALTLSLGARNSELVHIHNGQCGATLGGVAYNLTNFAGGSGASSTVVNATLASLQDGDHAINSHDAADASIYTACGNIPSGVMTMEPTPVTVPGATGVPGPRGSDGSAGPAGADGSQGPTGSTGPSGATGTTGATGPAGPSGAKGSTGDTGSSGSSGPAGPQGGPGTAGKDGSTGALPIVGLILAILAIIAVGGVIVLSRQN